MITADAVDTIDAFESLLEKTEKELVITIRNAPTMGNIEFEDSVYRAMSNCAKGTAFEGQINKTDKGAFPDIIAKEIYGVEAKQIQKSSTRTRGNSIFESTRASNVEHIYLMMHWDVIGEGQISWRRYEDCIADVVITHSPRYLLDVRLDSKDNLFHKMKIDYNEFRVLEQNEMMEYVRKQYAVEDGEAANNLWWLETRDRKPLATIESLNRKDGYKLVGEAFFLCPLVFGASSNHTKFTAVLAYWLSQGIVSQVVRDKFTSGGKEEIHGVMTPQIIARALKRKEQIIQATKDADDELICHFWGVDTPPLLEERLSRWLDEVEKHSDDENKKHIPLLRKEFSA